MTGWMLDKFSNRYKHKEKKKRFSAFPRITYICGKVEAGENIPASQSTVLASRRPNNN